MGLGCHDGTTSPSCRGLPLHHFPFHNPDVLSAVAPMPEMMMISSPFLSQTRRSPSLRTPKADVPPHPQPLTLKIQRTYLLTPIIPPPTSPAPRSDSARRTSRNVLPGRALPSLLWLRHLTRTSQLWRRIRTRSCGTSSSTETRLACSNKGSAMHKPLRWHTRFA